MFQVSPTAKSHQKPPSGGKGPEVRVSGWSVGTAAAWGAGRARDGTARFVSAVGSRGGSVGLVSLGEGARREPGLAGRGSRAALAPCKAFHPW